MGGAAATGGAGAGSVSRGFALGLAGVALLALGLALWLGSREWFFRDDFVFLGRMQDPQSWSWREVFLPLETRPWIFYRPLSMELFFYWGHRLFGLEALPYYAFSLALDFATAPLVYALARELHFERRAAAAAALLAVTRAPTLTEVFYASCFMYVAVLFTGLASAAAFLRYRRAGGAGWQLLSCLALLLAFGCNEVAALFPVVLALLALAAGLASLAPRSLLGLARALLPQALLTGAYLVFRFVLVGPVESDFWNLLVVPSIYSHRLGPHVLPNVAWLLEQTAGGLLPLLLAAALLAAAVGLLARSEAGRRQLPWLGRVAAGCSAWALVLLPAFALLPQRQARWAMMFAAPLSLLVAAPASALLRAQGVRHARLAEAALLALLLASLPFAPMAARGADPVGGPPRRLSAFVAQQALPGDAVLVVLYGGPGLASESEALRLRAATSSGRSLGVVEPGTHRTLRFHDVSRRPARGALRPDSVYVKLLPGLLFERADASWLERELPRRVPDLSPARALR